MSCPCCPPPSEYRRFFGRRMARHDARRYRRRGLPRTARGLVALAGDSRGATVLDVGGGVGTLALELVERGAARGTVFELSAGYEDAAAALLAEHRLADRLERRVGDFVAEEGLVEPHDVVVLHRVVCCYPDADALVGAAAGHARRRLLLTYPRERGLTRFGARAANLWLRATRCGFRVHVHPVAAIDEAAARAGLRLTDRRTEGVVWENATFERLPAGGSGNADGMEPRHRESDVDRRVAERIAAETEEARARRGERDPRGETEGEGGHTPQSAPPEDDETWL